MLEEGIAEEISLAENALVCPMHPADQFDAFATLSGEYGMGTEDIAARFGVNSTIVRQRLKLAAVSPSLLAAYRAGEMNLDQMTAFAITDDHAAQERVWRDLPRYDRSRRSILHVLTEGQVPADDRRVLFVGLEAYEQVGGSVIRDLFDEDDGGLLTDVELMHRLVRDKLEAAEGLRADGWGWVEVTPEFDYNLTGCSASMANRCRSRPLPVVRG